jgi:outer membrane receptor protein involved in Fe transport
MLPLLSPTTSFSCVAFRLPFWLFAAAVWLSVSPLFAGTTGKIAGTVRDAQSKEPLIGASVVVVETKQGAKSNLEGDYSVLNVQPGTFTVRVSYLGYKTKVIENVRVRVDYTTTLNVDMEVESVVGQEVVIRAERPLIVKDQTYTAATISAEEIKTLPIEDVGQAVRLQAGVVGNNFRGGRVGEVAYLVDGVSVTDVFDGNASRGGTVMIDPQSVQEVQVITGAFNAEYGQAMSGIVSVVTKEGGEKLEGQFQAYTGDLVTTQRGDFRFRNIADFSPVASPNIQASLSGPVPFTKNKLTFYAAARGIANRGFLFGRRQFVPNDVLADYDPNNFYALPRTGSGRVYPAVAGLFQTRQNADNALPIIDGRTGQQRFIALDNNGRAIIDRQNGERIFIPYDQLNTEYQFFDTFNRYENLGSGDNASVAMNSFQRFGAQGKLTFKPTEKLKLFYSLNMESENGRDYFSGGHGWQLNPDGFPENFRRTFNHIVGSTYTFNATTFLEARYSNFSSNTKSYTFADPFDSRYQGPGTGVGRGNSFALGGTVNDRIDRTTTTNQIKLDLTSQITQNHQIKSGIDIRLHSLDFQYIFISDLDSNLANGFLPGIPNAQTQFGHDVFNRRPIELSAYLQDKIEFNNFIINLGVRFDYFDSRDSIPRSQGDPSLFIRLDNDSIFAARNGTTNRRMAATSKFAISPRIGVSFPISERGTFYFSYGQFFQVPNFNLLFDNVLYKFPEAQAATVVPSPFGNPDIRPQRTIKGEIGLQQQLGENTGVSITAYYSDIRDLAGTAFLRTFNTQGIYFVYDNTDYALVRGIILSLNRRLSDNFRFSLNYTYQQAQGNSPDPRTAAIAIAGGNQVETQLFPLDWDQRHTLNGDLTFDGLGITASLIGRYGTGLPFSPSLFPPATAGLAREFRNANARPQSLIFDLRASRNFKIGETTIGVFLQVFNLFDRANENIVFSNTGRATYELVNLISNPEIQSFITNDQFFSRPDFFSEPRRLMLGVSYGF